MGEDQTSLEGFRLFSKENLKEAIREVLKEEGILGVAKKASGWSREYWGDENWLECRARILRLIKQNLILAWGDLDQDRYFRQPKDEGGAGWSEPIQWHRAIDQHFLPNKPEAKDRLDLRAFQTGKKRIRYLTLEKWGHCAAREALRVEGRENPANLRRLRENYGWTEPCELDRLRYEGAENVEDDIQLPVIVSNSEGGLNEGEKAIMEARREPSNEGGGS